MSPQEQRTEPDVAPAQSWESLDDDNEESPLTSFNNNVDVELAMDEMDEEENEESIRAFYEGFQQKRPPLMTHFSFSELSNESSPLLNPLKSMPKGTASKFWIHRLWRWYNQRLHRRPVVTKSISAGVIVSLGDVAGQIIGITSSSSSQTSFDVVRLARFCSMGIFLQAPITHYYYHALDHYFPPTPTPWTWITLLKLIIDQTIYAPSFLFAVILYLGLLEGDSWGKIETQLQEQYVSTMVANWKVWIPATVINMAYVPPVFRVLYCNVVFFGWSIFLSVVLNGDPPSNG